jgi:hypothetical protein
MTSRDIINMRLHNQQLSAATFSRPADLVSWMGAIQAQDYAGAKWALANRLKNPVESEIDKALNDGEILRTHVLRPTWHFVSPRDIRWMLQLTEPRISAFCAKHFRDLQLDNSILKRSNNVIARALEEGQHLTKTEIGDALRKAGIETEDLRLTFIIIRAELDQLICNGARRGKQFTYALLEQRAPNSKRLHKDEALSELAKRYFTSRGPATVRDFTWWSGLSNIDARSATENIKSQLSVEVVKEQTYLFMPSGKDPVKGSRVLLLPPWDEYTVAYKDRSLVIDPEFEKEAGHGIFNSNIVVNGYLKGSWRRELKGHSLEFESRYFSPPPKTLLQKVTSTAKLYAKFLGKDLTLKKTS